MTNKYELIPQGGANSEADPIIQKIVSAFEKKQRLYEERARQLEKISRVMRTLVPIGAEAHREYSARRITDVDRYFFSSALLHQAWNFLQGAKLAPDFVDYQADITMNPLQAKTTERNLSDIMAFARNKGKYKKATRDAQEDMIRGEAFIYRDYEVDEEGRNVKLEWEHIPWKNVRMPYDESDWILFWDLSVDKYVEKYGRRMLKKVSSGRILNTSTDEGRYINNNSMQIAEKDTIQRIQVVRYIDPAQKVYAEIHGGNGYVFKKLEGDKYPFTDSDGDAYAPVYRRVFYKPFSGYHGWGPLDMLLSVARLESTIVNAAANRGVLAADPLVMMASNDPVEAKRMWKQHLRDQQSGAVTPFFVEDSNKGTKITPVNITPGDTNANLQFWHEFLINQATQRTGIDFKALTEFAPTAEQQRLRKQETDKMNLSVLNANRDTDIAMAKEDVYTLQNTTSKFHNLTVWVPTLDEDFMGVEGADLEELRDDKGELPKKDVKISKVLNTVKNTEFEITPRLEGALDDRTFLDLMAKKEDIGLLTPGTEAQRKAILEYYNSAHPTTKIREEDFTVAIVPQPPEQPAAEGAEAGAAAALGGGGGGLPAIGQAETALPV